MKKINFELIKKIDYVLFLIIVILGIVGLCGVFINEFILTRRAYTQTHLNIVEKNSNEEIVETIEFLQTIKDVYIFSVKSSAIKKDDLEEQENVTVYNDFSNSIYQKNSDTSLTNLIFVKENEEYKLFEKNKYIYKWELINKERNYSYKHDYNVYAVIDDDTNKDKILGSKDSISLYMSDYDGKNVCKLSRAIVGFEFIDDNKCIFSEYEDGKLSFFMFDGKNKKLIKEVEQKLSQKSIRMLNNR